MTDFSNFDEARLLDLIEGEMEPGEALRLRRELEAVPGAREMVDLLIADCTVLRGADDPSLPCDFVETIESRLARPMLIESQPGEYRRRRRRESRRRRIGRFAAAAVLGLALLGGVWAASVAVDFGGLLPGERSNMVADAVPATGGSASDRGSAMAGSGMHETDAGAVAVAPGTSVSGSSLDGTIHHHRPMRELVMVLLADADPLDHESSTATATQSVAATFAVVLESVPDAEDALVDLIHAEGSGGALVRNFTFEDASQLHQEWILAKRSRRVDQEPRAASASPDTTTTSAFGPDQEDLIRRQAREFLRTQESEAKPIILAGRKELSPGFEHQLEWSGQGAAYTMCIRADRLHDMLQRLGTLGEGAMLIPVDEDGIVLPIPEGLTDWAGRDRASRRAVEQLGRLDHDDIVWLPVVIR